MNRDARDILGLTKQSILSQRALLSRALNAAVILCESRTVMPPGFFLECEVAFGVVSSKKALINSGLIALPRREVSLEKLIDKKRSEYGSVRARFEGLFDDNKVDFLLNATPYFVQRQTKIGNEATIKWEEGPDVGTSWDTLKRHLSSQAVDKLRQAPRLLLNDGEALTWPALLPHLSAEVLENEAEIRVFLQRNYFTLYVDEFDLVVLKEIPGYLDIFALPSPQNKYSYKILDQAFSVLGMNWVLGSTAENLLQLKRSASFIDFIDLHCQMATNAKSETDYFHSLSKASSAVNFKDRIAQICGFTNGRLGKASLHENTISSITAEFESLNIEIRKLGDFESRLASGTGVAREEKSTKIDSVLPRALSLKNVAIATANIRETRAILSYFGTLINDESEIETLPNDLLLPRHQLRLPTKFGSVMITVVEADETGGDEAVDLLERVLKRLSPDAVFFVGCAALLDEKHAFKANTVFLARRAYDSDKNQERPTKTYYDMEAHPSDLAIQRMFKTINARKWFGAINFVANRDFISGSTFLGNRRSRKRQALVNTFPSDAVVVENEAFDVFKKVQKLRAMGVEIRVAVLKGISDLGDENAQTNKDESQTLATTNAATVLGVFLQQVAG